MLFISHISALEYWRRIEEPGGLRLPFASSAIWNRQCNLGSASSCAPSTTQVANLLERLSFLEVPVHCMVVHPQCRRESGCAVAHVHSRPLPSRSFVRIADGVYVASPELCFIQMAEAFPRFDALKLGFELAGSYRLSQTERGFSDAQSVMGVPGLEDYLASESGLRGAKVARSCLPFIVSDSASPKETQLAMVLCAARRAGAYGLPRPRLNHSIALDDEAKAMAGSEYCRADICWPESKLIVEYDSDFAHTGSERIAADSARRSALLHAGMRIVGVTRMQLHSRFALDRVVSVLEGQLGMRPRSASEPWRRAQLEFRRQVIKTDRYGLRSPADAGF